MYVINVYTSDNVAEIQHKRFLIKFSLLFNSILFSYSVNSICYIKFEDILITSPYFSVLET